MKKKFMMLLLSAMMVTGSMSIAHAAEPDEDIADEIIDVSDEKLTVYDGEEIAPRMDSLKRLFTMEYKNLLKNERVTTTLKGSAYSFDPKDIKTKSLHITVTPDTNKSTDTCSLRVGVGYPTAN